MVELSGSEICKRVRRLLNEANINEAEFYTGEDETEYDDLIKSKVFEALNFVNLNCRIDYLEPDSVSDEPTISQVGSTGRYVAKLEVEDFLRLVGIDSDWDAEYLEVEDRSSDEYAKQKDKYAMGTEERPKVFLVHKSSGDVLELYSFDSEGAEVSVSYQSYIKEWSDPTTEDDETTDVVSETTDEEVEQVVKISDKLVDPCLYYISSLVLLSMNDRHSEDFSGMAMVLMGVQPTKAAQQ